MKNSQYFPHDFNAHRDEKIIRMIKKIGWAGYGIYWALVERIYEAGGSVISDYDVLEFDLHTETPLLKSVMEDFCLFYVKDGRLKSESIDRRIAERNSRSLLAEANGRLGGLAKAKQSLSNGLARKEKKRKEIKEKERKEKTDIAQSPSASEPILLSFPCVGNGTMEWGLTHSKAKEYLESFPAVDIEIEARKALQWCRDNPQKRKTFRGMPAFLSRWFSKAQDKGVVNA